MHMLLNLLAMFGPLRAAKLWVAVAMAVVAFVRVYFGIDLGLDEETATAVIGGIFTRNTGRNLDQVPFFGDIPVLGVLFQRRRSSDTRGELVIFITPRIVNRAEALGR